MRWHVQSEECMCTVRALLSKSKLCGGVSCPLPLLFLVARPPDPGTLSLWCVYNIRRFGSQSIAQTTAVDGASGLTILSYRT